MLDGVLCGYRVDHGYCGRGSQRPTGTPFIHGLVVSLAEDLLIQTFGNIFGLSDAIIGLTIFAAGNSLADLVANMSVAVSLWYPSRFSRQLTPLT